MTKNVITTMIEKINVDFHKRIMFALFDLGRISYKKEYEQFKAELASICREYLIELYTSLRSLGVIEGQLRWEYDVDKFNRQKINKDEFLDVIKVIYIDSPFSFLRKLDSFSKFAFNSNKIVEFDDNEIMEYEVLHNAESSYFMTRAEEIVKKTYEDFSKYCDAFYEKDNKN